MGREYLFGVSWFRLGGYNDSMEVCHFIWNDCSCSFSITVSQLLDDAFYQVVQATVMMCILAEGILRHSGSLLLRYDLCYFFRQTESLKILLLFLDAPSFFSKILMPPTEDKFCFYELLLIGHALLVSVLSKRPYSLKMKIRTGL